MRIQIQNLRKLAGTIIFVLLVSMLFAGNLSAAYGEEIVIVSMDLNRIVEIHPAFQEAIQKYRDEVLQAQEEVAESMAGLSQEEAMMLQGEVEQYLQQRAMQLQSEALDQIKEDIQQIADEKGYDYVVADGMLYAGGPIKDATEDILEALNQK